MHKHIKQLAIAGTALGLVFGATEANASFVYTTTNTAGITSISGFAGANIETFDAVVPGSYSNITLGNTTLSVNSGAAMYIDNSYIGQYNNFGVNSLQNSYNSNAFSELDFTFTQPVNALGFHWGASDNQWTLNTYDALHNLIESEVLPITHGSNDGDFVGIVNSNIKFASLIGDAGDYVFVDNIATTGVSHVPLPATLPMFGAGLLGMFGFRRKHATA